MGVHERWRHREQQQHLPLVLSLHHNPISRSRCWEQPSSSSAAWPCPPSTSATQPPPVSVITASAASVRPPPAATRTPSASTGTLSVDLSRYRRVSGLTPASACWTMTTRVILKPGDAVPWTWSVQPTPSDPISTDSERFDHRKLKSTFST